VVRSARARRRLAAETALAGLAYGSGLCWVSTCIVGSFRPADMADPYWRAIPGLRTDTSGIVAFAVCAVCLAVSEYLRLSRRHDSPQPESADAGRVPIRLAVLAAAETVALLSTVLVAYLSVNAVTHPATLALRATHLAPWPTEGTLRVMALVACVCSVSVLRWLQLSTDEQVGSPSSRREARADD
jgi:hypothetical protein